MTQAGVRIGSDLVLVADIAHSLQCFGGRYLNRLFTPGEIQYCLQSPAEQTRRLAARFAAKEATLKVLRPDRHWLDWRSIEVIRSPQGWCDLLLHGHAEQLRQQAGIASLSVSLSHEGHYALAVVAATFHVA